ncbi:unnamed protein product [Mytilus coruscus]|uniref:Mab-21-like HhH/H2TH-like domain-containing protein n=1 Tax=Mytilus coruscus TaxID=42192 RepID=A0A6J8F2Q5_MYTCO|nr:unnamed protein product [Mytilus coruscus]
MSADRAESLRFYNYLRNKIGTEKIVKARRLAFIINDAGAQSDFPQIGSGSRGEGLDLKGSDIDLMYIDSNFIVHESEKDVVKGRKVPLVMDTLDTQPCFTRLRVFTEKAIPKSLKRIVQGNGLQKFLSNDIYKRHQLNLLSANSPPLINIHGPCLSDDKEDFDFAFCLKCDKWISHAQPWINRSRTTWPSSKLTSKILATSLSKDIFILIMSLAHQIRPQTKYFPYKPNNKKLYFKYRCDLGHLLVGVNSDAVSGWLMIATLFNTYKRHGIVLRILNYVLSKCNEEHIYIPPKRSLVIFNQTHQSLLDSMKQEKMITILKAVTRSDLHFYLRSSIIPTELQLDVIKYVTPFPHLSYAYFLKFLCFFHLNDLPKCKDSINQIRLEIYRTVNSDNGVFLHLLKSLVCYGVAYQMIGELDFSRYVFQMVAKIDREHKTSALLRLSHLSAL